MRPDLSKKSLLELKRGLEAMGLESEGSTLCTSIWWHEILHRLNDYQKQTGRSILKGMLTDVERFNLEIIGVDVPSEPTMLGGDRMTHAVDHMHEELSEFEDADTLEGQADGLIDLVYVALGRLIEMGIAPGPVFEEVHAANMRKAAGNISKRPNSGGKDAVKPKDWTPPDLEPLLRVTLAQVHIAAKYGPPCTPSSDVVRVVGIVDPEELELIVPSSDHGGHAVRSGSGTKILVIGYARHGKDTVGEMLRDHWGMQFTSSSQFLADEVIMPRLAPLYGYKTGEECFEDRGNHRKEWYDLICEYNTPDAAALGRALFEENDVYVGLRSKAELHALLNSGVVDHIIWVDRSDVLPPEDVSSCTVEPWMAHWIIDNNGSLKDLAFNVEQLMRRLLP